MSLQREPSPATENLRVLCERISRQAEKAIPFLAELGEADGAFLCSREGAGAPLLRELHPALPAPAPHTSCLAEHRVMLSLALACGGEALLPVYAEALIRACRTGGAPLTLADFVSVRASGAARVAYMKNPYADEAYEAFASSLPSPTVSYTDSYRAACEEVAMAEADFCILPYENAGGYLASTDALAERYGLLRTAGCRVFHADGTDVTHFALYGRAFLACDAEAACTLLYRFPYGEEGSLARHFAAAAAFSVHATRVYAEKSEDEAYPMRATVTAAVPKKTLLPYLTYLTVFVRELVVCGLYKEKEL